MIDVTPFVEALGGKPVALFGLGVSGSATLKALEAVGANVLAADDMGDIEIKTTSLDVKILSKCACLILSPGVPLYYPQQHPVVIAARAAGIPIICDIEVFGRCNPGRKVIGITGTNGKSTTAALLHHVLNECGIDSQLGGNIGKAVLSLDMPPDDGVFVLELSSYQLDLCPTFSPDIAVLLNITPDHLDRHGSLENYAASKAQIFESPPLTPPQAGGQRGIAEPGGSYAVIVTDDGYTKRIADDVAQKGARDVTRISAKDVDFETAVLKGAHNQQNIAAVMAVVKILGLDETQVRAAVETFPGLPHRQFPVRTVNGVTYINDSKATNAEAAAKALSAFDDIYWIAGGQAKDGGLKGLEGHIGHVRHVFLIGEAADKFADWLGDQSVSYTKCGTLDKAVQAAHAAATSGTVLLSPACASWDQFKSFEDRGNQFTKLVDAL